eukprot:765389-Hanusia_phi.AAC.1
MTRRDRTAILNPSSAKAVLARTIISTATAARQCSVCRCDSGPAPSEVRSSAAGLQRNSLCRRLSGAGNSGTNRRLRGPLTQCRVGPCSLYGTDPAAGTHHARTGPSPAERHCCSNQRPINKNVKHTSIPDRTRNDGRVSK